MFKRAILFLVISILFGASCQKEEYKSEAINAIPMRSAIVVRVNSLQKLAQDLAGSIPGQAIEQSIMFQNLSAFVELLGTHQATNGKDILAYGGFDQHGAGKFSWIWSLDEDEIPFITKTNLASHGTISARAYSSSEIVHFSSEKLDFFFAHHKGLLLLSTEENLVESALKQLESRIQLGKNDQFISTLNTTSAKDPANVFIHWSAVPDWSNSFLADKIKWPGNLGTWTAMDLDINENDINFTGISLVPDSANVYMGLFSGAGSGSLQFPSIVPENTALAVSQSCSNLSSWHANLEEYLGKQNRLKKRTTQLNALGITPNEWMNLIDEEIGIFYNDGAANAEESKNGFMRISDLDKMTKILVAQSDGFTEEYREKTIGKIGTRNVLPLLFGKLYSNLSEPYWFVHNDWIIFSNSLASAKANINSLLASKTWATSGAFANTENYLDTDANLALVARNPEWLNLIEKELNTKTASGFKTSKESLKPINWVVANVRQKSSSAYSELVLLHQTQTVTSAKQFWGIDLDAPAISSPQLVLNHNNKTREIVIQDQSHNLYLIDGSGKILWKKPLDGPILGRISQVDMYKNRKLQLAFNTAQRLYIVDRNGNDVAPFPVTLKQHATAPMSVFDYENTRKYRFVIPCGKRLLNYNIEGKEVSGWNHKKTKENIILQPKHAVIGNKDFIYTVDASGRVYLLNRRGEVREKITNRIPELASELYLVNDKNVGGKLSALSKSGYTISLFINDQLDSIQPFGDEPIFMNVVGKTQLLASAYEIYKRDEVTNFDIDVENKIISAPQFFQIGDRQFIAVTTDENEIWIFNETGSPLSGMPLYGNGVATVGRTSGKDIHVIVSTNEGALLDYKLSN